MLPQNSAAVCTKPSLGPGSPSSFQPQAHLRILGVSQPLLQAAVGGIAAVARLSAGQLVLSGLHSQLSAAGAEAGGEGVGKECRNS